MTKWWKYKFKVKRWFPEGEEEYEVEINILRFFLVWGGSKECIQQAKTMIDRFNDPFLQIDFLGASPVDKRNRS